MPLNPLKNYSQLLEYDKVRLRQNTKYIHWFKK